MVRPALKRAVVPDDLDGERIDRVVAHAAGISRREARVWIATGRVRIAGQVVRVLSRTVNAGRRVEWEAPLAEGPRDVTLSILHLDKDLIAIDKPAGLLSEGEPVSVEHVLRAELQRRKERDWLRLVHRLDATTSGVLLVARKPAAAAALGHLFKSGDVEKRYLALVVGTLARAVEINQPIGREQGTRHGVRKDGKPAATRVTPLGVVNGMTLVRAEPRTGRTHQIRVHLAHVGHPLLGDALYGGPRYDAQGSLPIRRPMLHAREITVRHPTSGALMHFTAPVPEDFVTLAAHLGLEAALRAAVAGAALHEGPTVR